VILPKAGSDLPFDFLQNLTWVDFSQVEKVSDAPDQLERLVAAIQGGLTAVDEVRQAICPWRGLDAFREEDSAFFCGRGSESEPQSPIGQLVRRVRAHSFVMVVGRSGSGKSSLVFAGLIPALRRERNRFWNVLTVRPGQSPLRALAAAFNPPAEDEGAAGRLLLYVDQWEELYAQAPSSGDKERASQHGADANRFVDLLLTAARTARVTVIGTVRADFYDPLIGHPDLRALLPTRQILIARMSRSELQSTIDGPAKKVGLTFDPVSLVQRILDEAGQDESVLPLLQYALKESWALRKANTITADAYARSGGVREAIRTTADRAFNALSEEDQRIARRLFLRLVTPGEGKEDTRARAAMPLEPTQRKVVELFADARTRLLVTGSDDAHQPTIEIAHEALIRTRPQLREWIDAHREKLRARAAAVQAKAEWEQNRRRDDLLLLAGFQLERAKDLLKDPGDLTVDDIQSFIDRSSEREKRERKEREEQQRRLGALTIFSLGIQSVSAGSNSYSSNAKPQPLTELEEAILIAAVGMTGLGFADRESPTGETILGTPNLNFLGRAAGSTDNYQATSFFLLNDSGTYFLKRLSNIDPTEPITRDLLVRRARWGTPFRLYSTTNIALPAPTPMMLISIASIKATAARSIWSRYRIYKDEVIACTKDICTYIYERHGRFPAHCDSVFAPGVGCRRIISFELLRLTIPRWLQRDTAGISTALARPISGNSAWKGNYRRDESCSGAISAPWLFQPDRRSGRRLPPREPRPRPR
jgi:hypothetical protein